MIHLAMLCACLVLVACGDDLLGDKRHEESTRSPRVIVDNETGCQYLTRNSSASALTPRIGAGGKHMGCQP